MRAPEFPLPSIEEDGASPRLQHTWATITDLRGLFADEDARLGFPAESVVYEVQSVQPVAAGTEGGLFCGGTLIMPGQVGGEYFMTRGHFHARRDRGEFYWCTDGEGILLLMGEDGVCRPEPMRPGTMHYIPGHTAHRAVNTGHEILSFSACWPSDAGHDYSSLAGHPFPVRVFDVDGVATLVESCR